MIQICIYSFYYDRFLKDCLKSIYASNYSDFLIDLYVYSREKDTHTNDFTNYTKIEISILNQLKNYSEITNLSIMKAKQNNIDYFMLLNSDTILHPYCLLNLKNVLDLKSTLGVVGGFQTKYDGEWSEPNNWTSEILKTSDVKYSIKLDKKYFNLYKCSYVQGACLMTKTSVFEKVGIFDERFKLFYEETEFCRRVIRQNLDVGILEEAKVKHYSGGTWKKNKLFHFRRDIYYLSNQLIFESTNNSSSLSDLTKEVTTIIKKQILNIHNKKDGHIIPLILYPTVIIFTLFRIRFFYSLYKDQVCVFNKL